MKWLTTPLNQNNKYEATFPILRPLIFMQINCKKFTSLLNINFDTLTFLIKLFVHSKRQSIGLQTKTEIMIIDCLTTWVNIYIKSPLIKWNFSIRFLLSHQHKIPGKTLHDECQ